VTARESLPADLAAAHALILAERAARIEAETKLADARAEAANAQADLSSTEAFISHLKLEIEKLRRQLYGTRSEHKARLLDQMELRLEDLEAAATEDELAAEKAAARTKTVPSFERKRPSRKPFPDHLPRERVVIPALESWIQEAVEAGRGRHRDVGGDSSPVEGDPDGAREVLVPGLRDDHPAAGTVPCNTARLCRTSAGLVPRHVGWSQASHTIRLASGDRRAEEKKSCASGEDVAGRRAKPVEVDCHDGVDGFAVAV
jgi:hypothetical protein